MSHEIHSACITIELDWQADGGGTSVVLCPPERTGEWHGQERDGADDKGRGAAPQTEGTLLLPVRYRGHSQF